MTNVRRERICSCKKHSRVARKADFVAAANLPLVFAAAIKVICCCKWRDSSYRHGFNAASKMHFAATRNV